MTKTVKAMKTIRLIRDLDCSKCDWPELVSTHEVMSKKMLSLECVHCGWKRKVQKGKVSR